MPELYTPFIQQNIDKFIADRERKQSNELASSAYMGDKEALSRLYAINPEFANRIEQQKAQQEQSALTRSYQQSRLQIQQSEARNKIVRQIAQDAAMMPFEQAKAYAAEQAQLNGIDAPELTPQLHEQFKMAFASSGETAEIKTRNRLLADLNSPDENVRKSAAIALRTEPGAMPDTSYYGEKEAAVQGARTPAMAEQAANKEFIKRINNRISENRSFVDDYKKSTAVYRALVDDFEKEVSGAPGSQLSAKAQRIVANLFGNPESLDYQAGLEQKLQLLLSGVPFPPGAQSNYEMQAREAQLGPIRDPNASPEQKMKALGDFIKSLDAKAKVSEQVINEESEFLKPYLKTPENTPKANDDFENMGDDELDAQIAELQGIK